MIKIRLNKKLGNLGWAGGYEELKNKVIQGDCLDVVQSIPGKRDSKLKIQNAFQPQLKL